MLTADLIRRACPHASADYVNAFSSPAAWDVFLAHGLTTPRVLAAMMANIDHETGGLTIVRENMKHSEASARKAYGAATFARVLNAIRLAKGKSSAERERLISNAAYGHRGGNEDDGENDDDGYRYRGGGPLQSTFKPQYRALQKLTGIPFLDQPELIERPEHWPIIAALTFAKHPSAGNLATFAEQGNFLACCKGINTGSPFSKITVNGLEDREAKYVKWCALLDVGRADAAAEPPAWVYRYGMPVSSAVAEIQKRLNLLRYAEGKLDTDGNFGPRTRSAVQDFQTMNDLTVDGVVGDATWKLLFSADAKPWPAPSTVALGVAGMRAAGDPEIAAADTDRATGVLLATAAAGKGLADSGLLDWAGELAKDLQGWQSTLTTIIAAMKFGAGNFMSIAITVAALYFLNRYRLRIADALGRWLKPIEVEGAK